MLIFGECDQTRSFDLADGAGASELNGRLSLDPKRASTSEEDFMDAVQIYACPALNHGTRCGRILDATHTCISGRIWAQSAYA